MSLALLVVIVVAGIVAVVAAVHLTGGSRKAQLAGEDMARARFAEDFPDAVVRSVHFTEDRHAAFLDLAGGVGIVQAFGGKFLTRLVTAADLASPPRATGSSITVRFRDFTWSGGLFEFGSGETAAEVERMFTAVRQSGIWEKQ